ncbi:hypothetical protein PTKIN_Ptkin11bG0144200 [Pterospermum kingtungense]
MSGREEGRPFGEEQAKKKRQGEGCESEEPKRQKVKDEGSVLRPYPPPHQVQARIKDFLQSLDENTSPADSISYVPGSRESPGDSMSHLPHFPDSSARGVDGGIFKAAEAFIRVWKVMSMCFGILINDNGEGRNWRRTLFYMLRNCSPHYFKSQLQDPATDQDDFYGSRIYLIPGDLERVAPLHLHSIGAKNIIVVEQDEVFEELMANLVFL